MLIRKNRKFTLVEFSIFINGILTKKKESVIAGINLSGIYLTLETTASICISISFLCVFFSAFFCSSLFFSFLVFFLSLFRSFLHHSRVNLFLFFVVLRWKTNQNPMVEQLDFRQTSSMKSDRNKSVSTIELCFHWKMSNKIAVCRSEMTKNVFYYWLFSFQNTINILWIELFIILLNVLILFFEHSRPLVNL